MSENIKEQSNFEEEPIKPESIIVETKKNKNKLRGQNRKVEESIKDEQKNPTIIQEEKDKLEKTFKEESPKETEEEQEVALELLEKKLQAMEGERFNMLLEHAKKITLNPLTLVKKGLGTMATFGAKFGGADGYECSRIMASFVIPKDKREEFLELNSKTEKLDKKVKALRENLGRSGNEPEESSSERSDEL